MAIFIKRVYERAERSDGYRILVDRLWPRGISKDDLQLDSWAKEAAPSASLRKWFDHDPARWGEFKQRYFRELDNGSGVGIEAILALLSRADVTLVYAAKDTRINHAVALKEYVEDTIAGQTRDIDRARGARDA